MLRYFRTARNGDREEIDRETYIVELSISHHAPAVRRWADTSNLFRTGAGILYEVVQQADTCPSCSSKIESALWVYCPYCSEKLPNEIERKG